MVSRAGRRDDRGASSYISARRTCHPPPESHVSSRHAQVICNDRLGKKIRVKCNEDDTIGDLKKLLAAQSGTRPEKIRIQKWYTVFKDHITLEDYEVGKRSGWKDSVRANNQAARAQIHDGMGLELYYN